jgi:DNA-binding Lrp family transcriptional regulator
VIQVRNAYILIQRNDVRDPLAPTLRAVPGVISADDVMGPYDAIVLAAHDPVERPVADVADDIQRIPGVTRALVASVISSHISLVEPQDELARASA